MASFQSIHTGVSISKTGGFQGPGLYRIMPYASNDKALQVTGPDDIRITTLNLQDPTQRWTIEQWGSDTPTRYKLFVQSNALAAKTVALEAFPRDNTVKPRIPSLSLTENQDQFWMIQVMEGNLEGLIKLCCASNSRGVVFLESSSEDERVLLKESDALSTNQLFRVERLDQRTMKLGFPGPGKYRIQSLSPHAQGKVLEAFPKHGEIRPRDLPPKTAPDNPDQHWVFIDQGDYLRIVCHTAKNEDVAFEAFPRENMVRPRQEKPTEADQWWRVTELGDGKTVKLSCLSKSRGLVCLDLPQDATHATVAPPSTSLTQHFQLIPFFEPPKAFNGPGSYRITNARSSLALEAFPQQNMIKLVPTSAAMDQRWVIEKIATSAEDGDMLKISCHTRNAGLITWEAFPRDDVVRPEPVGIKQQDEDRIWYIEELGDGIHIKIFCYSKSRGKVYVEAPIGFPHVTVRCPSENPGQLFRLEGLGM